MHLVTEISEIWYLKRNVKRSSIVATSRILYQTTCLACRNPGWSQVLAKIHIQCMKEGHSRWKWIWNFLFVTKSTDLLVQSPMYTSSPSTKVLHKLQENCTHSHPNKSPPKWATLKGYPYFFHKNSCKSYIEDSREAWPVQWHKHLLTFSQSPTRWVHHDSVCISMIRVCNITKISIWPQDAKKR